MLLLSSNNYLGLATHPALRAAATAAIARYGCGTGASRLIAGHLDLHAEVEAKLAAFKGTPAALLFPSGYQANVGAITALVGRGDHVYSDALNHASIIDGCRLSGATIHVYPHRDITVLERLLAVERLILAASIEAGEEGGNTGERQADVDPGLGRGVTKSSAAVGSASPRVSSAAAGRATCRTLVRKRIVQSLRTCWK